MKSPIVAIGPFLLKTNVRPINYPFAYLTICYVPLRNFQHMAYKRKDPDCSLHKVKLCDHSLKGVQLVKIKRLRGGQSTISDAINYIVEDWIDKNYIKLMRD